LSGLLPFIVWFARHDMCPQPAVGRENTMKPGEVNPWLRNQRSQATHKPHWAEDD